MVKALDKETPENSTKRVILSNIQEMLNKDIEDFVCADTLKFFQRFQLSISFLNLDPRFWEENAEYKASAGMVQKLKVVNDAAERGVKLISDYANILTKDEDQKQAILQTVSEYRKLFPNVTKETMAKKL